MNLSYGTEGELRNSRLDDKMGKIGGIMPSELELYIQNQEKLLEKYNGKIIALHHGEVVGVFETKHKALEAMMTKYQPGDFMIIKCTPGDKEYTRRFRSRVHFPQAASL